MRNQLSSHMRLSTASKDHLLVRENLAVVRTCYGIVALLAAIAFCLLPGLQQAYAEEAVTIQITGTYNQTQSREMLSAINVWRADSASNWYWDSSGNKVTPGAKGALVYDYNLEKVAMQRAMEIAVRWSHSRPNGQNYFSAYSVAGVESSMQGKGENIAVNYSSSYATAFEQWQETDEDHSGQGHRRNMLGVDIDYNRIGIACVKYNGCYYWVQELGRSSSGYSDSAATAANDSQATSDIEILPSLISGVQLVASPESISIPVGQTSALPTVTANLNISEQRPSRKVITSISPSWQLASGGAHASLDLGLGAVKSVSAGAATLRAAYALGSSEHTLDVPVTVSAPLEKSMVSLNAASAVYDSKSHKPKVTVKDGSTVLRQETDYTVTMLNSNGKTVTSAESAGTYTIIVKGQGCYTGSVSTEYAISRADNPVTVTSTAKKVKLSAVKKKAQTVAPLSLKNAQGKKAFKVTTWTTKKAKKYFTVNANSGKVTAKKGTPKGTYKFVVKVTAKGDSNYKAKSVSKTVKILVK